LEQAQAFLGLRFRKCQGGDDANSIAASSNYQETTFPSQLDYRGWVCSKFYAEEHTIASNFFNSLWVLGLDAFQSLLQHTASRLDLFQEIRLAQTVKDIKSNSSGQWVSSESCAVVTYTMTN